MSRAPATRRLRRGSAGTNFSGFFASPVVREEEVFTAVASFLFGRRNCGPCDAAPRSSAASSARAAPRRLREGRDAPAVASALAAGRRRRRRASIVHHASRDAREELALEALGVFAAGDDERSSRRVHHLVHRRLRGRGLPEQRRLRRLRVPRPALVRAAERRRAAARERAARRRARRRRVPPERRPRRARDASSRAAASHSEPSPTPSAPRRRRLPSPPEKKLAEPPTRNGRSPSPSSSSSSPEDDVSIAESISSAARSGTNTSSTASSSPRSANANASNASNASSLGGTTSAAPSASSIPPGGGSRALAARRRETRPVPVPSRGSPPRLLVRTPRTTPSRARRRGAPVAKGIAEADGSVSFAFARAGAAGLPDPNAGSVAMGARRRAAVARSARLRAAVASPFDSDAAGGFAPGRLSPRGRGGARRRRRVRPSGRRRRRLSRDAPRCVSSDGPGERGRRALAGVAERAGRLVIARGRGGEALSAGRGDERVVEALEGVRGVAVPASAHGERGAREAEGVALGAIVGAKARAARLGRVVHRKQDVEGAARRATRRGGVPRDGVGRVLADAVRAERALRERLEPTPERQSALGRVRARRSLGRHRRARRVLAPARGAGPCARARPAAPPAVGWEPPDEGRRAGGTRALRVDV